MTTKTSIWRFREVVLVSGGGVQRFQIAAVATYKGLREANAAQEAAHGKQSTTHYETGQQLGCQH